MAYTRDEHQTAEDTMPWHQQNSFAKYSRYQSIFIARLPDGACH